MNYEDLEYEDLLHLTSEYSNYIMEFDCKESGHPVCVSEFYEYEYQEILKENS